MVDKIQPYTLKKANSLRGQEISKRRPKGAQAKGDSEGHLIRDVMEMLKNISLWLASFTPRFESYSGQPLHLRLSPKTIVKCE